MAIGPAARRKTKGRCGVVLAAPGFTWAMSFFPGRWYSITSSYDPRGDLVAHHVDLCVPCEERDGVLSFLDLKLDLLIRADGGSAWLDQDEYADEIRAGAISPAWQQEVKDTAAALESAHRAGEFPPPEIARYQPPGSAAAR